MINEAKSINIVKKLSIQYGKVKTMLKYNNPFELLVAVILSAQCTDKRVNEVSQNLFKYLKTPSDFAKADIEYIEELIRPTGFFRNKAKNIKKMSIQLINDYNEKVPKKMEDLVKLAGVGRKTANVVLSDAFSIIEGIVVDTHVKRLSNRIGFVKEDNPEKIEKELMKIIPKKYWYEYSHYLILHGRNICKARKVECNNCIIKNLCEYGGKFEC